MRTFLHVDDDSSTDSKDKIRVEYDAPTSFLEISLRRTIRVPDNGESYDLPPDCGALPLYSVNEFKDKLPAEMVAKGRCFTAIYRVFVSFPKSKN
jgi:hypothetical protein